MCDLRLKTSGFVGEILCVMNDNFLTCFLFLFPSFLSVSVPPFLCLTSPPTFLSGSSSKKFPLSSWANVEVKMSGQFVLLFFATSARERERGGESESESDRDRERETRGGGVEVREKGRAVRMHL